MTAILRLAPFFEPMGTWTTNDPPSRKEFWWEREWRKVGELHFSFSHLVAVLAPEESHETIGNEFNLNTRDKRKLLDPKWGLERMISSLAGIPPHLAGPLPEWNAT